MADHNNSETNAIKFVRQLSSTDNEALDKNILKNEALDHVSDYVFISDSITKEIIYMNKTLTDVLQQAPGEVLHCYSVFRNRKAPCKHCRNNSCEGEGYIITHNNLPVLNKALVLKSTQFETNGHIYTISIAKSKQDAVDLAPDISNITDEQKILAKVIQTLSKHKDSPNLQIFSSIQFIGQMSKAQSVSIYENRRVDANITQKFQRSAFWSKDNKTDVSDSLELDLPYSFVDYAMSRNSTFLYKTEELTDYEALHSDLKGLEINDVLTIPVVHSKKTLGLVFIKNISASEYEKYESAITILIDYISVMMFSRLQSIELDNTRHIDSLTGFRNRNALLIDLKGFATLRNIGVAFVNINCLQAINQKLGLKKGDEVIVQTGRLIKELLHINNVYRISGDEFFAVYPDISEQEFQKRCDVLAAFLTNGASFTAAIGTDWKLHGYEILEALTVAEKKMIANKEEYYRDNPKDGPDRDRNELMLNLLSPENIHRLIANGNFFVQYQPKFNIQKNDVAGAEALIRLQFDNRKIAPNDFIPHLDASHYTHVIDMFVVENVCQNMQKRVEKGLQIKPVSCNFSRHTMIMSGFVDELTAITNRYGIPHSMITVEVSEQSDTLYHDELIETANALSEHGFNISIDDFGVAHANISSLVDLPVTEVKFDKKVIDSLLTKNNGKVSTILNMMINMCHKMGIKTVAEGVEETSQLEILKRLGCDEIQGYLLSRPISMKDYYDLLK